MAGVITTIPKFQFSDSNGRPLALGTVTTYVTNSTTPSTTWQNKALNSANTNPIQLDANGECVMWLDPSVVYRFVLKNAAGSTSWTVDNIAGAQQAGLDITLAASGGAATIGFLQAGADAVARTMQSKGRDIVSVKDFGALGNGVHDDTDCINNAASALKILGGGTLLFPCGTYLVRPDDLVIDVTDVSIVLAGDGPNASTLSSTGAGTLLTVTIPDSNVSSFSMMGMGFSGDVSNLGLYVDGVWKQGTVVDCLFNALDTCIQGEQVFHIVFNNVKFRNYAIGVRGTSGSVMQNNTFINCYWMDGKNVSPAVAKPIDSTYMGYNAYVDCNFESRGLIASVDLRGTGYNTMLGCRFEQLNAGTSSWLILGNNDKVRDATFHVSGTYNCAGTAYYIVDIGASTYGKGCVVDGITISNSNYASNTLRLNSGAVGNYVRFETPQVSDPYDAVYNVVTDVSAGDNIIEYPGGSFEKNTSAGIADTWGGGPVTNWIATSLTMGSFTFDGLTDSAGPAGASNAALGPLGNGYVRDLNTPTGNKKAYFQFNSTATYVYCGSIWVCPKSDGDVVQLALDRTLATTTWRSITLASTNRWQRVWIMFKAPTSSVIYFQLKTTAGVYVSRPQFEEWAAAYQRLGPAGFVATGPDSGGQVYGYQLEGKPFDKRNMDGLSTVGAPTVGRYNVGDKFWYLDVAAAGAPGIVCVTSGAPGTWKAMAAVAA